jgi:hypothetical protein
MKHLVWLTVIVALALTTLPALAYASPPDETWIRGLYDNADYDDVVSLATSALVTQGSLGPGFEFLRGSVATLAASTTPRIVDFGVAVRVPRGPPNA